MVSVMGRRQLLGAAAGIVLASCARPGGQARPAAGGGSAALRIRCDAVFMAARAIRRAWAQAHPDIALRIRPLLPSLAGAVTTEANGWSVGQLVDQEDVFQLEGDDAGIGPGQVQDLTALLRARNFAAQNVVGLSSFAFEGRQYGLPLWLEPTALLVNRPLAARLGVTAPSGPWTLDGLEAAVGQAVNQQGSQPGLVVGFPWTDVRLWGALVLGFGGRLTTGAGGLDLGGPAGAAATAQLMNLAQQGGWYSGARSGRLQFVSAGFTGAVAAALFVIESVPIYFHGTTHAGLGFSRFPLLPVDPVIPVASAQGLAVSPRSHASEEAVTFMLWLYEPAQQQALMAFGVPPIVRSAALARAFAAERSVAANVISLADPAHLSDVLAPLPKIVQGQGYSGTLAAELSRAQRDPTHLASYLAAAQQALEGQIAATATACAKVPLPARC